MPYDDPLADRAAFAQRFKSTGNLDQRRRFAQDISEAKAREEERDAAAFEALQQQNPKLMDAVTKRMSERRLGVERQQNFGLQERKFERQLARDVTVDELNERKFKLQEDNAKVMRHKAVLDIDRAERERDDTFAYEVGEMQLRDEFGPGTTEYRQGVAELAASLPYLNKQIRQESLKEVGFEDPDEAFKQASEFLKKGGKRVTGISVGNGMKGTMEAPKSVDSIKEEDLDDEISKAYADRSAAKKAAKSNPDEGPERRVMVERRIKELEARKLQLEKGTPSTAPAPTAPVKPGETVTIDIAKKLIQEAGGDVNKARALGKERGYQW